MGGVIQRYYDNRLENIGNPTSFVWYGKYMIRFFQTALSDIAI